MQKSLDGEPLRSSSVTVGYNWWQAGRLSMMKCRLCCRHVSSRGHASESDPIVDGA